MRDKVTVVTNKTSTSTSLLIPEGVFTQGGCDGGDRVPVEKCYSIDSINAEIELAFKVHKGTGKWELKTKMNAGALSDRMCLTAPQQTGLTNGTTFSTNVTGTRSDSNYHYMNGLIKWSAIKGLNDCGLGCNTDCDEIDYYGAEQCPSKEYVCRTGNNTMSGSFPPQGLILAHSGMIPGNCNGAIDMLDILEGSMGASAESTLGKFSNCIDDINNADIWCDQPPVMSGRTAIDDLLHSWKQETRDNNLCP